MYTLCQRPRRNPRASSTAMLGAQGVGEHLSTAVPEPARQPAPGRLPPPPRPSLAGAVLRPALYLNDVVRDLQVQPVRLHKADDLLEDLAGVVRVVGDTGDA